MTYSDFCQFCGSFIQHMLEMRIVRLNFQTLPPLPNFTEMTRFFIVDDSDVLLLLFSCLAGGYRNDGMDDQYCILIRFDDQHSADSFYKHFTGRRFSSLEVCFTPEFSIISIYLLWNVQGSGSQF